MKLTAALLTSLLLILVTPAASHFPASAQTVLASAESEAARKLVAAGQYPEAIAAYKQLLAGNPGNDTFALELAHCYRLVHNYEEARNTLQRARKLHPKSVPLLKALGSLELEAESYDAAVEALKAAVALAPNDLEAHNLLGSAYQGKNDASSALAEFNRVLTQYPQNQLAHYLRAQLYADSGENEKALADAEKVVAARPGYLPGLTLLAKVLVRLNQCARAVDTLRPPYEAHLLETQSLFLLANAGECAGKSELAKAVRQEFTAAAQADHQRAEDEVQSKHLVEQANLAARENKFPEALEFLQQALQKNPRNAFAYSQQAKILFSKGDVAEARAAIARAIALQPFQPDFLYVEGVIAQREGKFDEAFAAFTKATEINPKEADAFFEIGKIRLRQGNRTAALAAFRTAVALDPADPEYQSALASAAARP